MSRNFWLPGPRAISRWLPSQSNPTGVDCGSPRGQVVARWAISGAANRSWWLAGMTLPFGSVIASSRRLVVLRLHEFQIKLDLDLVSQREGIHPDWKETELNAELAAPE